VHPTAVARAFLPLGIATLNASAERTYEPLLYRGHTSTPLLRGLFHAEHNSALSQLRRTRKTADMPDWIPQDATTIRGLYSTTDDCIMFSRLLSDELVRHGQRLAPKLPKRLRGSFPSSDFSRQEREGLMPDPKEFPSWMPPQTAPVQRLSWRQRIGRAWHALSE
jgi:hypothetical protein